MNEEYRAMLRETAERLERWIDETHTGGWSTHHVDAMRDQANRIWSLLGRTEVRRW